MTDVATKAKVIAAIEAIKEDRTAQLRLPVRCRDRYLPLLPFRPRR
jgi:hypothetical protein